MDGKVFFKEGIVVDNNYLDNYEENVLSFV